MRSVSPLTARSLRRDPTALNNLRERLFILWGNLEELKSAGKLTPETPPSSIPFECCIKEYGVQQNDKWLRLHRMFMTVIRL